MKMKYEMDLDSYFYECSPEYIQSISPFLLDEIRSCVIKLTKRQTQSEINADLFWLLTSKGWSYDTMPAGIGKSHPEGRSIREENNRKLCKTSTTLQANWHADFAKAYDEKLVQIEVQFGKVEAMFKDFCGFRIAFAERRLSLGIEIVLHDPGSYFAHRKKSIGGMASFSIAKNTLSTIGLECPIWLIGIIE